MVVAPSCSTVLPVTAVEQFSGNNLSQNDARVIQLSSPMKKTHIKEILYVAVVVMGQQAVWPGWVDYCFWAFVSCGKASSSAHPVIKKSALHHPFSVSHFSPPPSLTGVMWMYAASPLLVCDACCGLSAGTFNSTRQQSSHTTNVSSSERLCRLMGQQRRLLLIGGKCTAHGVGLSRVGEVV